MMIHPVKVQRILAGRWSNCALAVQRPTRYRLHDAQTSMVLDICSCAGEATLLLNEHFGPLPDNVAVDGSRSSGIVAVY